MITIAMVGTLLAEGLVDSWIVKGLAIAGGAVVGGLFVGLIARAATRTLTTRPMPLWGVRLLRFVGGVASGWLVWLFLSSTGSGKPGGDGGLLPGGPSKTSDKSVQLPETKDDKKKKPTKAASGKAVRVEVLGEDTLEILKKTLKPPPKEGHIYRIEDDPERRLYDLKGMEDELLHRRDNNRSLQVILVRYKDSPKEGLQVVSLLKEWLTARDMFDKIDPTNKDSPEVRNSTP